ncbi:ArsR/SmtB family transcription factor [Zavarzinia aquatilis]|uniref:Transcriptional regulator n=1 Tax=Zavarzinia aquatilis TaxID=2211142 RepID=A0A317EFK8_9PROT|nr:metalloregulator ArsR/SmtB family transcription factor [Zavarzinia aquatilis]PWR24930.1 transcriptional regulator [Zavarzinia aquatilis]
MSGGAKGDELLPMADRAAEFLKVLANANRLMIVCHLLDGEASVAELEAQLGIRQPTLSQQLGILREAGIVLGRRDAKSVIYQLSDERARPLIAVMNQLFCGGAVPEGTAPSHPAMTSAPRGLSAGEAAVFPTVRRPQRNTVG